MFKQKDSSLQRSLKLQFFSANVTLRFELVLITTKRLYSTCFLNAFPMYVILKVLEDT